MQLALSQASGTNQQITALRQGHYRVTDLGPSLSLMRNPPLCN